MRLRPGRQVPHISVLQCGMLIAGAAAISNHALSVTYVLQAGGRDAWLGGLLAFPAVALAVAALVALSRRFPGQSLVQYLPRVLGKGLGHVVAALYILYFLAGLAFTLERTTLWVVDSILPETPPWVIFGLYLMACAYAAAGGIQTLARTNQFALPLITLFGIFISVATMRAKDYGLLRPFLENGLGPPLRAALVAAGVLGELCVLGMFAQYVRSGQQAQAGLRQGGGQRLLLAAMAGVLFEVVTMTGPVSGAIATLGPRPAANMPYPTYQQWLMVSFARFVERTDLLAVHQWLVGAYVRTGLLLFAAATGTYQLLGRGRWTWYLLGGGALVWGGSQLLFPNILVFDDFVSRLYLPTSAVLGVALPPLLWLVAALRRLPAKGVRPDGQGQTR